MAEPTAPASVGVAAAGAPLMQACDVAKESAALRTRLMNDTRSVEDFVGSARNNASAEARHRHRPGPGEVSVYPNAMLGTVLEPKQNIVAPDHKLGQLLSTAICGNDITSSCFYVTGALADAAGIWAPIGALLASLTLWLFRWIYTEAVSALPFNGGIYNLLLNTLRNKRIAAHVATLTMLSYMATAVVSALSAGAYLQSVIDDSKQDPLENGNYTIHVAITLLVFFCLLKLVGISESATVAAVIFVFHLVTMSVLIIIAFIAIMSPTGRLPFDLMQRNLVANWHYSGKSHQHVSKRIVLGFANAMLGVSGFESSSNFVEEQKPGVFPKTLRNMWYAVSVLNMTFILECLFATELAELVPNRDKSLSFLALRTGGRWLQIWVSIDAFAVLAASVLTSYVGIGGLVNRLAGDRCLPAIFHRSDKIATILFMCVCISLTLILEGNSTALSACYSFAFLTVMALFAVSLLILQLQRPKLPRAMKNNVGIPVLAFVMVMVALISALISNKHIIPVFMLYLFVLVSLMALFSFRLKVLTTLEKLLALCGCVPRRCIDAVARVNHNILQQSSAVYFTKSDNICRLNKAINYVLRNEDTRHIRIVHVYDTEQTIPQQLVHCCQVLDAIYPKIRVDVVFVNGVFGGPLIKHLSGEWDVAPNLMFITCPASEEAGKRIQDLQGVRVIMSHEEEFDTDGFGTDRDNAITALCEQGASSSSTWQPSRSTECPMSVTTMLEHGVARAVSWSHSSRSRSSSESSEVCRWPVTEALSCPDLGRP